MRVVIGLDAEGKAHLQDNRGGAETKEAVGAMAGADVSGLCVSVAMKGNRYLLGML